MMTNQHRYRHVDNVIDQWNTSKLFLFCDEEIIRMKHEIVLHKIIRRELKSKGLTLNALAKQSGIPQATLHGWLNGQTPSAHNLIKIKNLSEFFGISVSELLFGEDDKTTEAKTLYTTSFLDQGKEYIINISRKSKD